MTPGSKNSGCSLRLFGGVRTIEAGVVSAGHAAVERHRHAALWLRKRART